MNKTAILNMLYQLDVAALQQLATHNAAARQVVRDILSYARHCGIEPDQARLELFIVFLGLTQYPH